MNERVALYARVSTAHQEQEQTIASQVAALEHAATTRGLTVAAARHYLDEGYSGSYLARPGLDALRDAAADGLLDRVFVYCPDRLARNFVHQQILLEELTARGVAVDFVEHPIGERPEDRLLVQMQGVIAEYERTKILERTRRGRLHKVRAGQIPPFTRAPYGYAIHRTPAAPHGIVVVEEAEAAHVRAMYRWVLDEGLSARQVATRLHAQGVPPRRARRWTAGTVHGILTNPAYTGLAIFGKREPSEPKRPHHPGAYRKRAKSSHRLRPEAQWVQVPIPALVDDATQRAVRARLARNKVWAPRNVQHDYLLRRLVVCGVCGWRMACVHRQYAATHRDYFFYACGQRAPVDTGRDAYCPAHYVRADDLDAVVWDAVVTWLQSPEMLLTEAAAAQDPHPDADACARDRARLEGTCRRLQGQIDRLLDAYQHGAIEVDELKARRAHVAAELAAARARAEELAARGLDGARTQRLAEDLRAFAATLRDGLAGLDFAGRQRLVQLLVERIVITGDDVAIEHAIPLSGRHSGLRQGLRGDPAVAAGHGPDPMPTWRTAGNGGGHVDSKIRRRVKLERSFSRFASRRCVPMSRRRHDAGLRPRTRADAGGPRRRAGPRSGAGGTVPDPRRARGRGRAGRRARRLSPGGARWRRLRAPSRGTGRGHGRSDGPGRTRGRSDRAPSTGPARGGGRGLQPPREGDRRGRRRRRPRAALPVRDAPGALPGAAVPAARRPDRVPGEVSARS
jgi:site-specific DNA recombinase